MNPTKLGIKDFINMTDEFYSTWSLFAVESSFEEVVGFSTRFYKSLKVNNNISICLQNIEGSLKEKLQDRDFANVIPILKTHENNWILLYSEVFYGGISAPSAASSFSRKLNTRAIVLIREDTSESLSYELLDKGIPVESATYEYGEDRFSWKSKIRKKPKLQFQKEIQDIPKVQEPPKIILSPYPQSLNPSQSLWIPNKAFSPVLDSPPQQNEEVDEFEKMYEENWLIWCDFLNSTFGELNIYLPACYAIKDNNNLYLEIKKCSEDSIDLNNLAFLY
jgi:hypothetical protein